MEERPFALEHSRHERPNGLGEWRPSYGPPSGVLWADSAPAGMGTQPVSDPRLRQQVDGFGGLRLDLLSKLVDHDPQIVHFVAVIGPPHRLQHLTMCDHFVDVNGEIPEHVELFGVSRTRRPRAVTDRASKSISTAPSLRRLMPAPCVQGVRRRAARMRARSSGVLNGLVT